MRNISWPRSSIKVRIQYFRIAQTKYVLSVICFWSQTGYFRYDIAKQEWLTRLSTSELRGIHNVISLLVSKLVWHMIDAWLGTLMQHMISLTSTFIKCIHKISNIRVHTEILWYYIRLFSWECSTFVSIETFYFTRTRLCFFFLSFSSFCSSFFCKAWREMTKDECSLVIGSPC